MLLVSCLPFASANCRNFEKSAPDHNVGGQSGADGSRPGASGAPHTNAGAGPSGDEGGAGPSGGEGGARSSGDEGGAGSSGDKGGAGSSGNGGAFGTNGPEELPVPYCTLYADSPAPMLGPAGAVAAATAWSGVGIEAYVTQPELQWIATAWESAFNSDDWLPWICFDAVPTPRTISAIQLASGFPEVFVTTASGALFVRRQIPTGWLPWKQLNLPKVDSTARDVSGVKPRSSRAQLAIADRDGIYLRAKISDDPYSGYGPWRMIGTKLAERVSIGVLASGSLQVFALTLNGSLSYTVQNSPMFDADFGEWHDIANHDAARLIDIDCGYSDANELILYAVDEHGLLLQRNLSAGGWWVVVSDVNTPKLLTVSASVGSSTLLGVSISGVVYRYAPGANWIPLP